MNETNTNRITTACALVLGLATAAGAATVQADFGAVGHTLGTGNGTTTEGGTTWNGIEPGASGANLTAGTTQTYNNLLDSSGGATAVDLSLTWSNQTGLDFSRAWDLHPGSRDGDYLGIRGDNNNLYNTVTWSDLTPGDHYDVTVWANSVTGFRVNGGAVVVVSGSTNTTTVNAAASHTFAYMAVNGSGQLIVDWGRIGTGLVGNDLWTTTTAMSITEVPAPAALPAGLGLLGVAVARRRRR